MDGGVKQEEIAVQLKREVKERARSRRGEHSVFVSSDFMMPPRHPLGT